MAMMKPKTGARKPAAKSAFVGYGTNVTAGKKITKNVKKKVLSGVSKASNNTKAYRDGFKAGQAGRSTLSPDSPYYFKNSPTGRGMKTGEATKYYGNKETSGSSKRPSPLKRKPRGN